METTVADFEQQQQQQQQQIFVIELSPLWFQEPVATTSKEEEKVENNVRLGFSLCGSQSAGVFVRKIFCQNNEQLKVGDKVIRVNGKSSAGYGPDQLARMLRYVLAAGDSLVLTISRSKLRHIPAVHNHVMASSISEGQNLHNRARRRSSKVGQIFDMPETPVGAPMTVPASGVGGDGGLFCLLFRRQMTSSAMKKCGKFSPRVFQRRSVSYSPLKYSKFSTTKNHEQRCSNDGFSNTAYNTEPNPDFLVADDGEENLDGRPAVFLPMKMVNCSVDKPVIHRKTRKDSLCEELPLINFDRLGRLTPLISSQIP